MLNPDPARLKRPCQQSPERALPTVTHGWWQPTLGGSIWSSSCLSRAWRRTRDSCRPPSIWAEMAARSVSMSLKVGRCTGSCRRQAKGLTCCA